MKHSKIKGPAFRANSPSAGSRGTPTLEQAAWPGLVTEVRRTFSMAREAGAGPGPPQIQSSETKLF